VFTESDRCPEAAAGRIRGQLVVYRTDSGQEVRNRRFSFPSIFYNSSLQLRETTTTITNYRGRSAYHYYYFYYYYCHAEVAFAFRAKNFEKYHFKNCNTI
jgi:hypothetical protein